MMYDKLENCSVVDKLGKKIFKAEVSPIFTEKNIIDMTMLKTLQN